MSFRGFRPLAGLVMLMSWLAPLGAAPAPHGWPEDAWRPLTKARIEALPEAERAPWLAYWEKSEQQMATLAERPRPDASSMQKLSSAPKGGAHTDGLPLRAQPAWYGGAEAQAAADRVVAAQSRFGGWAKGHDYRGPEATGAGEHRDWAVGTFDNDATTTELRFLAEVIAAAGEGARPAWRAAWAKGLAYIFAAQYPHGGFPQVYPLIGGYHDGVTLNDHAMVHVLELLREAAAGKAPYEFVSAAERAEAAERFRRGVDCLLAAQSRDAEGRLTVWGQQLDPLTLRPAAARNFEPIADCSSESVGVVRLLMRLKQPTPAEVAAVEGAIAWFQRTALRDLRIARAPRDLRGEAVPEPGAPPIWARYYECGTATPIFGDRDRTVHYDLSEISPERVHGYGWYTDGPRALLEAYPAWRKRVE